MFVEYETPRGAPEPPVEVVADLDDRQRLLLQRIKEWRKETAEERGLPAYVICTNRQAAEVARRRPATLEALKSINGFGRKKVERFGKALVELVLNFDGASDA